MYGSEIEIPWVVWIIGGAIGLGALIAIVSIIGGLVIYPVWRTLFSDKCPTSGCQVMPRDHRGPCGRVVGLQWTGDKMTGTAVRTYNNRDLQYREESTNTRRIIMNIERARMILADYEEILQFLPATQGPFERDPTPREAMCHLHGMLRRMREFLDSYESETGSREDWEKFNRWLGFMQGVFWLHGDFTLNQMRDHNRVEDPDNLGLEEAWWDDEGFWIQQRGELCGPFGSEERGIEEVAGHGSQF